MRTRRPNPRSPAVAVAILLLGSATVAQDGWRCDHVEVAGEDRELSVCHRGAGQADPDDGVSVELKGPDWCEAKLACPPGGFLYCDGQTSCSSSRKSDQRQIACDAIVSSCLAADPSAATSSQPQLESWKLAFEDTFSKTKLDPTRWTSNYNGFLADSWIVRDGTAVLRLESSAPDPAPWGGRVVALTTQDRFAQAYGWFEIRARVASSGGTGGGIHSAFWLLPQDPTYARDVAQNGYRTPTEAFEIDIFEQLTLYPQRNIHTVHAGRNPAFMPKGQDVIHRRAWADLAYGIELAEDFHTYALEWTPESLTWYFDGRAVSRSAFVPHKPFYVLLNLYEGAGWTGTLSPDVPYPIEFVVDYVRVYCLPGQPCQPFQGGR